MELIDLKRQIMARTLNNMYIFTGEETAGMNVYINKISEVLGLEIVRLDTVAELYSRLQSVTLFKQSFLYIVRNDITLQKKSDLYAKIQHLINNKNDFILFIYDKIDKRTEFYKANEEIIVPFNHFTEFALLRYLNNVVRLTHDNAVNLIEQCNRDYGRLMLEADKIKFYSNGDDNLAYTSLNNNDMFYSEPEDLIFPFIDAVLDRKRVLSISLYEKCKEYGTPNLAIISLLFTNIKYLVQVQSCRSSDVMKSTGLSYPQFKGAEKHIGKYGTGELINAMRVIQQVEADIKSGMIEDEFSVAYILVKIL